VTADRRAALHGHVARVSLSPAVCADAAPVRLQRCEQRGPSHLAIIFASPCRIVRHGFRHPANPRSDPTSRTVAVVAASSVISKA
jgi:hypothetical protein